MTILDYIRAITAEQIKHPGRRAGQNIFNAVWELDPEFADSIRGTSADPFYDNSIIPTFYVALGEHLS